MEVTLTTHDPKAFGKKRVLWRKQVTIFIQIFLSEVC